MTQTTLELPSHYVPSGGIDLANDKKSKLKVKGMALAVFVVLFLLANHFVPFILLFFDKAGEPASTPDLIAKVGAIVLIALFYVIVHEKIHGSFMERFSGVKASFGFSGSMAYAGSPAYFSKKDFRIIALAPVLILAIAIFLVTLLLPSDWFWVGYAAQLLNLSGSTGDFYTAWVLRREPVDVLIHDNGLVQTYFVADPEKALRDEAVREKQRTAASKRQNERIYGKKRRK